MTRTYDFYDNGRTLAYTTACAVRQVRQLAVGLFGPRTRYIDVLDEGVLVARLERPHAITYVRRGKRGL